VKLFRVLPYDANAAPNERGGVLYVPGSTAGRIANADLYRELYLSLEAEGAIAEVFGRLPIWQNSDFVRADGTKLALTSYALSDDAPIFDLDNVRALASFGIEHPSEVVTRNRKITQQWARRIFESGRYIGVRWWSYYEPAWTSIGLWDIVRLRPLGRPEALDTDHPLVAKTGRAIARQIERSSRGGAVRDER